MFHVSLKAEASYAISVSPLDESFSILYVSLKAEAGYDIFASPLDEAFPILYVSTKAEVSYGFCFISRWPVSSKAEAGVDAVFHLKLM